MTEDDRILKERERKHLEEQIYNTAVEFNKCKKEERALEERLSELHANIQRLDSLGIALTKSLESIEAELAEEK